MSFDPSMPSLRRRFPAWLLTLCFLLPVGGWVWAAQSNSDSAATQLLASELPSGVTLASANSDQMVAAVRASVRRDPRMAPGVVRVAIVTKVPETSRRPRASYRRTPRESKDMVSNGGKNVIDRDPCDYATRVLRAAIAEAPDQTRGLIEEATRTLPDCADAFAAVGGGAAGVDGVGGTAFGSFFGADGFGFGFGFGPGFIGSPPGGVLALPPTGTTITPIGNG